MSEDSWTVTGNELQRIVGLTMAICGFFTTALPEKYPLPFLDSSRGITQGLGFLIAMVGLYLFVRKKAVFTTTKKAASSIENQTSERSEESR